MKLLSPLFATVVALLACTLLASLRSPSTPSLAENGAATWNTDPVWYDGKAEKAVYRARRTIYGTARSYDATAYTNTQRQDPQTTVKSIAHSLPSRANQDLLVFKHHWSERAPTENYDYDYSTASFLEQESLEPYKLAVGTQEDCGASFKQAVVSKGKLAWLESVYHPDGGLRQGTLVARRDLQFEDALTLSLRDFPFESPRALALTLVPSQKSPKRVAFEPLSATVEHAGVADLELPIGTLRAHRLDLSVGGRMRASYWFAADGTAPLLHVLVRYEGPGGVVYELSHHERTAYWERG